MAAVAERGRHPRAERARDHRRDRNPLNQKNLQMNKLQLEELNLLVLRRSGLTLQHNIAG